MELADSWAEVLSLPFKEQVHAGTRRIAPLGQHIVAPPRNLNATDLQRKEDNDARDGNGA